MSTIVEVYFKFSFILFPKYLIEIYRKRDPSGDVLTNPRWTEPLNLLDPMLVHNAIRDRIVFPLADFRTWQGRQEIEEA